MSLFDDIFQAAKNLDRKKLNQLKASNRYLNIRNGYVTVIELLIENHFDDAVNLLMVIDGCKNAACRGYAREGNVDKMQWLLDQGVHVNWALSGAAQGGHLEIMQSLLVKGGELPVSRRIHNILFPNDYKRLNIDCAVVGAAVGGHVEIMQSLLDKGARINDAVYGAALGGHVEIMQMLLDKGARINDAVYGAAQGGHAEIILSLFGKGAIINGAIIDSAVDGASCGNHHELENGLRELKTEYPTIKKQEAQAEKIATLKKQAYSAVTAAKSALKELHQLSTANIPGAKEVWLEVSEWQAVRAEGLLAHGSEQEQLDAFELLTKLANWQVSSAVKNLEKHAAKLIARVEEGDQAALMELEKLAETIGIAAIYVGQYYSARINANSSSSSSFSSFFISTPESRAIKAFERAVALAEPKSHYYLGLCYEKKNKLLDAISSYFKGLTTQSCVPETLQQLKQLSADSNPTIAVAAILHQWLFNQNFTYLESAFDNHTEAAILFAVTNSQNQDLKLQHRLELLLKSLTLTMSPSLKKAVNEKLHDIFMSITKENANDCADLVMQTLQSHSAQRVALIIRCVSLLDKYPESFRAALLQKELQLPHAPDEQRQLENAWKQLTDDVKTPFNMQFEKKEEGLAVSASSSSVVEPVLSSQVVSSIQQVVQSEIAILENAKIKCAEQSAQIKIWIKLIQKESRTAEDLEIAQSVNAQIQQAGELLMFELYIESVKKFSPSIDEHSPAVVLKVKEVMLGVLNEQLKNIAVNHQQLESQAMREVGVFATRYMEPEDFPAVPQEQFEDELAPSVEPRARKQAVAL